ncbi:MAG: nitroreductase family protein [Anaerolineales bacterium]|nr:nitroreductase family protein [Anaerolineales bacterium]
MDFDQLVSLRYSCRQYSPDPIDQQLLDKVLNAARLAPTAANKQPFQIILIKTENKQEDLLKVYNRDWFVQAPLIICVCSIPEQGWIRHKYDNENYSTVDAAIVLDHITLQAADLGLGTCWIGAFNPQEARAYLKLPEGVEPVAFTPLGYPLDEPKEKTRKPLSDLIRYDTW